MLTHHSHRVLFSGLSFLLDAIQMWPWPASLNFSVWPSKTVSATINNDHDAYLRLPILIMATFSCQRFHQLFNPLIESVLRFYWPDLVIILDPLLGMVRFITSKSWADDDNVVEVFVVFFFNEV